jgi:organic hydroperoxide reductase OsmC/OhrA
MGFPKKLEYKITSDWNHETGGIVKAGDYRVNFDTPPEYDGEGKAPCPDHLFLASLAGCIMNTFLSFKNRLNVETEDVKIEAGMDVVLHNRDGYRVEEIRLIIKIFTSEEQIRLNRKCAEMALSYCHLTKSISEAIPLRSEVELVKV